jgi:hypothetical protein
MSDHVIPGPFIDPDRSIGLSDMGGHGLAAAVAVDADGNGSLWIVDVDALDRDQAAHGGNPRHEQVGELPGGWRERIWGRGGP